MSERLLFNAKSAIFYLYHGERGYILMRWQWCPFCTRPTCLVISLHFDTLSLYWANQSLIFSAVCLLERQAIPILYILVWPHQGFTLNYYVFSDKKNNEKYSTVFFSIYHNACFLLNLSWFVHKRQHTIQYSFWFVWI